MNDEDRLVALCPETDALRLVIEHAPAGIAMLDRDMRYVAVSRRYASDMGLDAPNVVGRIHYDVFPNSSPQRKDVHRRCLAGAVEHCREDPIARVNGAVELVTWEIRPWHDASGQIAGILFLTEVVTSQVLTLRSLRESEELLRNFFEQSAVGFAQIDPLSGRLVRVNEKLCEIARRTRSDLLGRTWQEFSHPEDTSTSLEAIARVMRGEDKSASVESRFVRADGNICWIRATITCMSLPSGGVALIAAAEDITEGKATNEALRRREAELSATFDLAPIGIAQSDPRSRRLVRVNRRMCEITGYAADELVAVAAPALTHPDDRPNSDKLFGELIRGERAGYQLEKRYVRKDGQLAWVNVHVTVLRDACGEPERLVATIEDITERKVAQRELEIYLSAFQAADNGIVITDAEGVAQCANVAASRLTGYEASEIVGNKLRLLRSGWQSQEFYRTLWETIGSGRVWRGELVNRRKDGSTYHEEQTITPVRDSAGVITHYIAIKQDITDRKRAEVALEEAEEQQRFALAAAELGIWRHDIGRQRMHLDDRAMAHWGFDRPDIASEDLVARIHPDERAAMRMSMSAARDPAGQGRHFSERRLLLPSGDERWLSVAVKVQFEGEGSARRPISTVATSRDITETKRAERRQRDIEQQLRAVQKLEAVGRLAGGIAHDFNNLLSVILSYAEVAVASLPIENPIRADLTEIVRAAQRAEALTEQLLAFSRRQVWRPGSVDLNALVQGIGKMLRRLIGEDIELDVVTGRDLFRTRVDPGQIEQVLMNLAVNARDAMPDGGCLRIAMANTEVDPARAAGLQVEPGLYVELTVSDTGCGMDAATLSHLFEPFFTTKGVGRGTGLGLSTVYGIVRQSGGGIVAESALGSGAIFRIFLKREETPSVVESPSVSPCLRSNGRETVLVIEDEPALRAVVHRVLTNAGYTVLVAANAGDALVLCEQRGSEVSIVLTDVIMPGMNGPTLARRLRPMCPSARVIFMSGYTDDTMDRLEVLGHDFLRKPFNRETLMQKVRGVLDGAVTL
ncbi:MAG: PAS domain S-box protein [Polyangiaceae bacterium]|jgi:PAS domain S-box-containing protein